MALLNLLLGIALPWAAGALALRAAAGDPPGPGSLLRHLGFGFFLGVAVLSVALRVSDALLGAFSWWAINAVFAGVAAVAGLQLLRASSRGQVRSGASLPPAERWLVLAGLCGIGFHFGFSLVEILAQPVFPWDGWTVWVYRAKAWFHAGHLAPIVSPVSWILSTDPEVYTTPALRYPYLPSLMPLWAALGLGQWHETLVNVPVLACAVAIALGLAGCLRGAGVGRVGAVAAIYLLFSTPIFGAHMSLGGYADIWLAGFAGLGMTGLLLGLLERRRGIVLLGSALLLLGVGVKVEGLAWCLAGALVVALSLLRSRTLLMIGGALVALAVLAWATGMTVIDIPGMGRVGWRRDLLFIPFKGVITLQVHDVGEAYLRNAFLLGSWHLLWAFVLAAGCLLLTRHAPRLARVSGAFFAVFITMQVVIFVFTTEGAWAQDYTAINRMPLQMLPAVLFLATVTLSRALPAGLAPLARPGIRRAVVFGLGSAVLVVGLSVMAWQWRMHGDETLQRLALDAEHLDFVIGGGQLEADTLMVERYQDGIALLSSGRVDLDSSQWRLLRLDLEFDDEIVSLDQAPAFFWRRANQPRQVSRITLDGARVFDLAASEDWYGRIVEFGFFFPENQGAPATIRQASLESLDLGNALALLPVQWTDFELWTQRSAHWLPGGAMRQALPLTGLVIATVLLAGLLAWCFAGRREGVLCLVVMLFIGWLALDLRWGWDRVRQAELSLAQLRHMSVAERMRDGELGVFSSYLERLAEEHFGAPPRRILLVRDPDEHRYFGLRAKYQLLPHSVSVVHELPGPLRMENADFVLFLGDFTDGDPSEIIGEWASRRWKRLGLDDTPARAWRLQLIDEDVQGTLFRIRRAERNR